MGRFALGKLGAPFGVKGEIKLFTYSGESAHLASLAELELRNSVRAVVLPVERIRPVSGFVLVKFAGIETPEAVSGYTNWEAFADPAFKAPLRDDEYYVSDLVGLTLVSREGLPLGEVLAVCALEHDDMLEVKTGEGATRLVPFRKEFVGTVDLQARRVELVAEWILE